MVLTRKRLLAILCSAWLRIVCTVLLLAGALIELGEEIVGKDIPYLGVHTGVIIFATGHLMHSIGEIVKGSASLVELRSRRDADTSAGDGPSADRSAPRAA